MYNENKDWNPSSRLSAYAERPKEHEVNKNNWECNNAI